VTSAFATVAAHPEAWVSLVVAPVAVLVRDRPWLLVASLVTGGVALRWAFLGLPVTSDQVAVSMAASELAFAGENPYGRGFDVTVPPGAPYPYGPLALLWGPLGVGAEVAAAVATMVVLAWTRSLVTLAAYASLLFVVRLGTAGVNDVSAGLLITVGLLLLRDRRVLGCVVLAAAAAAKPYAFAWFPGAVGYGGAAAAASLAISTAAFWSPLLAWGPSSLVRSFELAAAVHPEPENAFDVPLLRLLAIPIAVAAILRREWSFAVWSGVAIFLVVLYFDRWASLGYLLAIAPIAGITLERRFVERSAATDRAPFAPATVDGAVGR
jgi:hypothetical protein